MSAGNGIAAREGEETPLLRDQRSVDTDGESEETLAEPRLLGDEEDLVEDDGKANQQVGRRRGFFIMISLWGLIFLQSSNMSGLTTTQSKIAEDLDAFANASWFTSTYLIAISSPSPIAARLAQIFSLRSCIIVAAALFSIGGIVTSQAQSLAIFLLGRGITGIGGSGILTTSFLLVLELSGRKNRGLLIGLLNTCFTSGVALGAVVAGALLPITGWRPLFWAQGPLALIFGLGVFFSIPKSFKTGQDEVGKERTIKAKLSKIDYAGAITLTATIVFFLFGLSFPKILWIPIIISGFLLPLFIFIELRVASDPVIPVVVLKSRGALLSCIAQLGIMIARWMVLFYTPVYAIAVRGWSPVSAGSILIPTNLGFAFGSVLAGWLHIKRAGSFWLASIMSYFLFSLTILLLSQISTPTTPAPLYCLSVFACGFCTGAALNYTLAHLLHLTPPSTHFISTSLLTTFRGFAGSFGSAIGGGLFIRSLSGHLTDGFSKLPSDQPSHPLTPEQAELVRKLLGSPALVKQLEGKVKEVVVNAYVGSLSQLLLAGAALALGMVAVQGATGRRKGVVLKRHPDRGLVHEVGDGRGVEDEEWEEGMGQGV